MLGGLSRHFVCGVKAFNLTSAFRRLVLPSTAVCNAKTLFSSMSVDQDEGYVVKLRGLPWSATAEDVLEFFKGCKIVNGEYGIHMTTSREGRPSGEAFVEFEDEDHMESALTKDRDHIGNRYIEVFKVNRAEMEWVIKRNNPSNVTNDDGCVRLRGLPFGCSKEEIAQFFTGLEIVPNGITLLTDASGRSSGEAYVQFVNKEVAEKALLKHREKIGHRYIEIFRSSLTEVGSAVVFSGGRRFGGGGSGMGMGYGRPSPYDRGGDRFGGGNNGGRFQPRSSRNFKGGYSSNGSPDKSYGTFGGGSGWGSSNRNGSMDGGSGGGRDSFARFDSDYDVDWNNSSNGNMNDNSNRNSFGSGGGNDGWDNEQNEDGMHCVHMRGLPFKASQSDIADFFKPLVPVNIRLLQDKSGRASGEADVEFASHDESVRAMSNDKRHMQHRYIELFLNSADGDGEDLYSRRRRL